jgi:hypothetical protein
MPIELAANRPLSSQGVEAGPGPDDEERVTDDNDLRITDDDDTRITD